MRRGNQIIECAQNGESDMKLSIIVPVYNMASDGKLNYCLDSLAAQTISDYEVITVDDASTDESFSILLEYEKKYPGKFKAVHSEVNKRQGGAKNIGLSLAKGEWIGFIDSDDWILPTMYEKLIGRAEETGADMVGCDYCLTDEHSMKIGKRVENGKAEQSGVLGNKQCRSLILDSGSLVVKVYRREIFMDSGIRFPEHIFYEDNAISDAVLLQAHHYEYIPEVMYFYYQHERPRCIPSAGSAVKTGWRLDGAFWKMRRNSVILKSTDRKSALNTRCCFMSIRCFPIWSERVINRFLLSGRWETN